MAKKKFSRLGAAAAGAGAGVANGLFGAGGGMVLVPALQKLTDVEEESLFPTSVAVILPLCLLHRALGILIICGGIRSVL